jgi:membrane-associated phospholipid phosphatase
LIVLKHFELKDCKSNMDLKPENTDFPSTIKTSRRRQILRRLWRAEFMYIIALAGFTVLTIFAYFNAYFGWDIRVARLLQSIKLPGLFTFMRFMSLFGDHAIPYIITFITIIIFLIVKLKHEAAGLLLSAGGSALLDFVLKIFVNRPRPPVDLVEVFRIKQSKSFPSGHVTFYVCYFGFLFLLIYVLLPRISWLRRSLLILTAIPIIFVGISRVYLGEHWPSDTLGAYLMGGLWLAFSLDRYRRWKETTGPIQDKI